MTNTLSWFFDLFYSIYQVPRVVTQWYQINLRLNFYTFSEPGILHEPNAVDIQFVSREAVFHAGTTRQKPPSLLILSIISFQCQLSAFHPHSCYFFTLFLRIIFPPSEFLPFEDYDLMVKAPDFLEVFL